MKILNLYAGIGGNRKLWGDEHEITAVELNPEIAKIYGDFFPNDIVLVEDAHQYLLDHYKEFDFIWSSPPCPTHSITNFFLNAQGVIRYPDMSLYQEILFLQNFFEGKYVVENVKPYYEPLIKPQESGRHCFWANFRIPQIEVDMQIGRMNGANQQRQRSYKLDELGINLSNQDFNDKDKLLRNCVNPKLSLHILNCAMNIITSENVKQLVLL